MGSANLNSQIGRGLNNGEDALSQEHALDEKNKEVVANPEENEAVETAEKSQEITEALEKLNQTASIRNIPRVNRVEEYNAIEDIRQQCLFYLWTIFFGRSRANEIADKLGISSSNGMTQNSSNSGWGQYKNWSNGGQLQQLQMVPVTAFRITAERETLYTESESTSFSTSGSFISKVFA